MRLRIAILLATVVGLTACAQAAQPTPKTDDEKALYALGVILSQNIRTFDFTDKELDMVKAGLADGAQGKETMDADALQGYIPKLQQLETTRLAAAVKREKEAGSALLAKGPAYLGNVLAGIKDWMEEQGFESVDEFRGRVSALSVPNPAEFERANYVNILDSYSFSAGVMV